MIIRETDLCNPLALLAAVARRVDDSEGWHLLMSALKYLQEQKVEPDPIKNGGAK